MVNGYQKEKDLESRERFVIMRKMMWAALLPSMKKNFKEKDIIIFPWEETMIKTITIEEHEKMMSDIEKVKAFYARIDGKENKA